MQYLEKPMGLGVIKETHRFDRSVIAIGFHNSTWLEGPLTAVIQFQNKKPEPQRRIMATMTHRRGISIR